MRIGASAIIAIVALFVAGQAISVGAGSATHGPSKGTLILQGGVGFYQAIETRFVALAGGPNSHIVVIPTASVGDAGPPGMETHLAQRMKDAWGVAAVDVLHSLDRNKSNSDSFVGPLRKATGVWMLGGFPANLINSYLGTRTERAIKELLGRGGVVGGESAGAMIQASWLDTADDEDFTPAVRKLVKANGPAGFNLLTRAAVFPHFDARGPEAAVKFRETYPDDVGIGIDNETALVVSGSRAEVIGLKTVSIYDRRAKSPVVLHSGDHYDFAARK